jgi:hypothetical protein
MRKPKKPVVIWRGTRWLSTRRGRPVMAPAGCPLFTSSRALSEYFPGEKAVYVLVTITRIEEG